MTRGIRFPRRVFVNSTSILGGEAIARLATASMALIVARFFGPDALGHYGYALAVASVLVIVPDFGLHLFTVRELSASPERIREVFWVVHWLKIGLAGAVVVFTACFAEWGIRDPERSVIFYILVGRALLQSFSQATMAVFKAFERMHYVAFQQFVNTLVVALWAAVALALRADLPVLIAGFVAGQLAETGLGWIILRRIPMGAGLLRWDPRALTPLVAACFPIGLTAILLTLNMRIDILVLGRYVPSGALGQFSAAAWFVIATYLAASLLMTVLFPRLSRLLEGRSALRSDYVLSLLKNALWVSAAGALLVWLSAPHLVRWVLGPDFAAAAGTLRILAPALPLVFLNTILFYVFVAARRQIVCLATLGVGVAGGTLLSLYLTPRYGAAGCALADVARELTMSVMYFCFLARESHARLAGLALTKIFVGASASLTLAALVAAPPDPAAQWPAAWMVFLLAGTLLVLGFPNIRDWRLLTDDTP